MSEFFPDVVKNVVVRAVEVKKMVYMYLVHYADATGTCRELALLSINSFQKDLAAANQLIRALALRVMTSIRVPDIIQIQLLAIFKCASDSSPYVRRCAATAVPKVYALEPAQLPALVQALEKLLRDSSTMVLGSAVAAFNEVCPTNYGLLHRSYRKLCHLLADMDEWTQISVLTVLTRYVRTQFCDPAPETRAVILAQAQQRASSSASGAAAVTALEGSGKRTQRAIKRRVVKKAFYSDEEDVSEEEEVQIPDPLGPSGSLPSWSQAPGPTRYQSADAELDAAELDPDHKLLLRSCLPLLKSRNCGVVLAVATLHYYCGTQSEFIAAQLGKSLVRISRNRREIAFVVLKAIASMAQERPSMFRPFLRDFFVQPAADPSFCRTLKLDILTALTDADNVPLVLKELQSYVKHADKDFVCATVRAVGRVADAEPAVAAMCLNGLMSLLACVRSEKVAGQVVVVVRQLLQQNKKGAHIEEEEQERVVRQLAHVLLKEKGRQVPPPARASLIWIVGEFMRFVDAAAPDILRLLAQSFSEEEPPVKMQIVNLALKLRLYHAQMLRKASSGAGGKEMRLLEGEEEEDEAVAKLVRYVLEVARFDTNYDLRDRTRLLTACLGLAAGGGRAGGADTAALVALRAKADEVFLQTKLPPLTSRGPVATEGMPHLNISSLSWMLNHKVQGYEELPGWAAFPQDPSVRDAPKGLGEAAEQSTGSFGGATEEGRGREVGPEGGSEDSEFYSDETEGSDVDEDEGGSGEGFFSSSQDSESESASSVLPSEDSETDSVRDEPARTAATQSGLVSRLEGAGARFPEASSSSEGEEEDSSSEGSSSGYSSGSESEEEGKSLQDSSRAGYDGVTRDLLPTDRDKGALGQKAGLSAAPRSDEEGQDSESSLLDLEAYAVAKRDSLPNLVNGKAGGADEQLLDLMRGMEETSLSEKRTSSRITSAGDRVISAPHELLRHDVGGGLAVKYCFTRADPTPATSTLLLALTNKQQGPLRRIKLTSVHAADFKRLAPFPEIPVLEAGVTVEQTLRVHRGLNGVENLKLQFSTDRGGPYVVTVVLPPEESLLPHPVSSSEAEAIQRSLLGGFHESKASLSLPMALCDDPDSVPRKVLQTANLAWVSSLDRWQEERVALFASLLWRREDDERDRRGRMVIQISLDGNGGRLKLQVNCDDAVMSATLLEVLKKGLVRSEAPRSL